MSSSDLPFGIDVSKWQGKIDWDVIAKFDSPKLEFVGIRASINYAYTDTWFARNWSEAKRVGIPRTAYHVVYPGSSPEKQVSYFLDVVGSDIGELPLTLDCELDHNLHYTKIASCILQCAVLIESATGRKPLIYSRALWVDDYITGSGQTPPAWLNNYDWWLALYLNTTSEHPGPPTLPRGVNRERCKIHQTSQKGAPIGVQSKQLDYDRWQGTSASLLAYLSKLPSPPQTQTESNQSQTLEQRVKKLEDAAKAHGWSL